MGGGGAKYEMKKMLCAKNTKKSLFFKLRSGANAPLPPQ